MKITPTKAYPAYTSLRASHYMGLSLYILLLAFFIALSVLFEIKEDKTKSIMESVHQSFSGDKSLFGFVPTAPERNANQGQEGTLPEQQIKNLFGQNLGDLRIEESVNSLGRFQLSATLPKAMFQNYRSSFAQKLYEIIDNKELSTTFDLEFVLPIADGQEAFIKQTIDSSREQGFPVNRLAFVMNPHVSQGDIQLNFVFSNDYNPTSTQTIDAPEAKQTKE